MRARLHRESTRKRGGWVPGKVRRVIRRAAVRRRLSMKHRLKVRINLGPPEVRRPSLRAPKTLSKKSDPCLLSMTYTTNGTKRIKLVKPRKAEFIKLPRPIPGFVDIYERFIPIVTPTTKYSSIINLMKYDR
jgi:hypothetical protein